ncbi:MAG: hypothetical protein ACREXJ_10425, partial [Gammaproteobacteria bacterium]
VRRALDQGGYDNVTVQFIQYGQRAEVLREPNRLLGLIAPVWAFVRGLYGERPARGVPTIGASAGEQAPVSGDRPTPSAATATSADHTPPPTTATSTGKEAVVSDDRPTPPASAASADEILPAQPEVRGPQAMAEEGSGKTEDAPPPEGSGAGPSQGQGP